MTIVIPMAGLSNRFANAGFTLPKYMLYVGNKSLFYLSLIGFESLFKEHVFVFVLRNVFDSEKFVIKECELLGITFYEIIVLNEPTKGQAETVYLGLTKSQVVKNDEMLIYNIDTFRTNFKLPLNFQNWNGYLEVFNGEGDNWSYAKTENDFSTKVIKTAEKKQISQYCSTGLYYFESSNLFVSDS